MEHRNKFRRKAVLKLHAPEFIPAFAGEFTEHRNEFRRAAGAVQSSPEITCAGIYSGVRG